MDARSPSVHDLRARIEARFGDCDCRVVGRAEAEAYQRDMADGEAALDTLIEQFEAALQTLRDIRSAGHVGPQALSREGYMADQALLKLEGGTA